MFDNSVKNVVNGIIGANEKDYHIINFNVLRDFPDAKFCDLSVSVEGDACPDCGKSLTTFRGIEVGNIFQLGRHYTNLMSNAVFTDKNGQAKPYYMGCYGIGIGRTLAAIVERHNDENGIIWPKTVAPFQAQLISLDGTEKQAEKGKVSQL